MGIYEFSGGLTGFGRETAVKNIGEYADLEETLSKAFGMSFSDGPCPKLTKSLVILSDLSNKQYNQHFT